MSEDRGEIQGLKTILGLILQGLHQNAVQEVKRPGSRNARWGRLYEEP